MKRDLRRERAIAQAAGPLKVWQPRAAAPYQRRYQQVNIRKLERSLLEQAESDRRTAEAPDLKEFG